MGRWTRRQLGRFALTAGAVAGVPKWAVAAQSNAGARPGVSGPDSLRAHATARGLLYGAAVNAALLDVDGVAAGSTTDGYTQLVQGQTNILVAENAMKWAALRPTAQLRLCAGRLADAGVAASMIACGGTTCAGTKGCRHGLRPLPTRTTRGSCW